MITVQIPLWLVLLGLVLVIYFVWQLAGISDKLRKSEKKVSDLESKISRFEPQDSPFKNPPPLDFGPGYN